MAIAPIVFKKRYPQNPISLSTGKGLRFDDTGDSYGYLVTSDEATIAELNAYIADGRGGISVSTQADYDAALKKKLTLPRLTPSFLRENQTAGLVEHRVAQLAGVVGAVSVAAVVDKPVEEPVAVAATPVVPPTPKVGKRIPSKLP